MELNEHRSDEQFLRDILNVMSPVRLLDTISVELARYPHLDPKRRMWSDLHLSAIGGYPSDEKDALIEAQGCSRQRMLEGSPEFQTSLARLERAGVKAEWDYTCEYSYAARVLRLIVPCKALPFLEDLAASDIGIHDRDERKRTAELYQRWLLQNHHPEWERFRQEWPVVEESPYQRARDDGGPIKC